ncbi:hypothetical protein SUGI_0714310 [Cryptomeria japonica]|uniref:uncharacterized protein LOC131067289 n=1 Tax=Cryptomeria japonica TaxID=3369 RepID=UPI0024149B51|nr:uncharacterized protein LOC131067289 [Cryptomeria japonica]GLJ35527.1 hypothetical protein SUGI_0714310 [Cryptomeria japonica]
MSSLKLQSIFLFQLPSYCSPSAKPKNLIHNTRFLHLGRPLGFTYAHPLLGNNDRQVVNCRAWRAKKQSDESTAGPVEKGKEAGKKVNGREEEEYIEEEVELTWIQEKAEDLVEYTGTVIQAIPGPRVKKTSLPWLLAVPLGYMGLSFVIAVVKTIMKLNSPREKKRRLVNTNAMLCKTLDKLLESKPDELNYAALHRLMRKTGFGMEEILRKYIRYALNEKPFNPDLVASLIHLRKSSTLEDDKVSEVLNEVSRRIVKEKGPVVMDTEGFTEKGIQRKVAVQALFAKILYLAELDEFCSTARSSLSIKEIFGVTDEDADALRIETLSEASDMDSLEKMVELSSESDSEEADGEIRQ